MQEVFEKLIEKLEEEKNKTFFIETSRPQTQYRYGNSYRPLFDTAIKIVNEVVEEYDNGWIPVSEAMPPERDSMFAKLKGTDKWDNAMFERISDDVNVTVEYKDGTRRTKTMHTVDGKWKSESAVKSTVIAWQPLPKQYQPKGE